MEPTVFPAAPGGGVNGLSPLTLAYVGDGVYELLVRAHIVSLGNCPVKKLHSRGVAFSNCVFQSRVLHEVLEPLFTETEADICRRGRNAHVGHVPKNAEVAAYHGATALECVFGYLYLTGQPERLHLFFDAIVKYAEKEQTEYE